MKNFNTLKSFEISFSNDKGVFYAGTEVQGNVTVVLSDAMTMRGIRLTFKGKAFVDLKLPSKTEIHHPSRTTSTTHYVSSQVYFKEDRVVYGAGPEQGRSNDFELPKGTHTFPFSFPLDRNLPTSFVGRFGYILYTVKGRIDRPWKFDQKTKKAAYNVLGILDLNQLPNSRQSLQGWDQKTLGGLCCTSSGPIEASFHVERQGYVPGEDIELFADISNSSGRSISKCYVELKMIVTYSAHYKEKTSTTVRAKVERHGSKGRNGEYQWRGHRLTVPTLPPSGLEGCRIIDLRYVLELNVVLSGSSRSRLTIPLEITIGSIPLSDGRGIPPTPLFGATTLPTAQFAPPPGAM